MHMIQIWHSSILCSVTATCLIKSSRCDLYKKKSKTFTFELKSCLIGKRHRITSKRGGGRRPDGTSAPQEESLEAAVSQTPPLPPALWVHPKLFFSWASTEKTVCETPRLFGLRAGREAGIGRQRPACEGVCQAVAWWRVHNRGWSTAAYCHRCPPRAGYCDRLTSLHQKLVSQLTIAVSLR